MNKKPKTQIIRHTQLKQKNTHDFESNEAYYDEILKNVTCFDSMKYTSSSTKKKKTDIFEKCKEMEIISEPIKRFDKKSNSANKTNIIPTELFTNFLQTYDAE